MCVCVEMQSSKKKKENKEKYLLLWLLNVIAKQFSKYIGKSLFSIFNLNLRKESRPEKDNYMEGKH